MWSTVWSIIRVREPLYLLNAYLFLLFLRYMRHNLQKHALTLVFLISVIVSVIITFFITRSLSIFLQSMLFLKSIYPSNLPPFLLPNSIICAAASANPFIHVGTIYTLPYIPNSFGFVQHLPNSVIHFLTAWEWICFLPWHSIRTLPGSFTQHLSQGPELDNVFTYLIQCVFLEKRSCV